MGDVNGNSPHDLTLLLQDWCHGDQTALDRLVPIIYSELHRLAHIYMVRERPGHLLQTSALINEPYLRLTVIRNWKSSKLWLLHELKCRGET